MQVILNCHEVPWPSWPLQASHEGQGLIDADWMETFPLRTVLGAGVVLALAQMYGSFMTPWILLLFLAWVIGGSRLI